MQTHRAFVKVFWIDDPVDRIGGVNCARTSRVHFDCVCRSQLTSPGIQILRPEMEIFHQQAARGHEHPAVLVAMIVHRADLADFPANGNQFVQRRLVNQIAGVVLPVPADIGDQRLRRDAGAFEEGKDVTRVIECGLWKLVQLRDEILNGKLLRNNLHCHSLTSASKFFNRMHTDTVRATGLRAWRDCKSHHQYKPRSFHEHAVAIRIEPVFVFNRMAVSRKDCVFPRKPANQHKQRGLRQMKIRQHRPDHSKRKSGIDK